MDQPIEYDPAVVANLWEVEILDEASRLTDPSFVCPAVAETLALAVSSEIKKSTIIALAATVVMLVLILVAFSKTCEAVASG